MSTATDLKSDIESYGGDEVAEIGDSAPAFLLWLNNALINRHEEVCAILSKWTTDSFTFTTKGFEEAVPTDYDGTSTMNLYTDSDHNNNYDSWHKEFGVHRFDYEQSASTVYYRRYRQQATVYTAMSDTVTEIANVRLKKILMEEIIAMYLSAQNDLEASNAEQSTLNKANRNS